MPLEPIRLHAHNPGPYTGAGNITYLLVGAGGAATLIDAGQGREPHLRDLAAALDEHRAWLARVLVTHAHSDHIEGAAPLAAAYPDARFMKRLWPGRDDRFPAPWVGIDDGQAIDVDGEQLVAIHTPGHAPDHLVFWHEASRTAFVGDLALLGGTVMIPSRGGDLIEYLASIERLRALRPVRLLPAHGEPIDDAERFLARTVQRRLAREQHVLQALVAGHDTVQAIAESIYDGLDPAIMPAAHETVRAHLEKLRREGRAAEHDGRWTA